jgi:hypothetical protein
MKTALTAFAAILFMVGVARAQDSAAAKPDEAVARLLIANERALLDAVGKADRSAFESLVLLSDGFWTTKNGFVLMRQLAEGLEVFKLTKWEIGNPRVTWLSEGSAIVNYTWTGTGTLFDQPMPPMQSAVTVWTRRNGKWVAVSHQQTEVENPGAR